MEITQIQLSYIELQDRMIARINLGPDKHQSLILTRRICKFMIENLSAFLKVELPERDAPGQMDVAINRDLPFEERSPEGGLLDQGHEPVLVLNAGCNRTRDGLTFTFFTKENQSLNLNLSPVLASAIHQILIDVTKVAQWFEGLGSIAQNKSEQAEMPSEEEKKTITYH